MKVKKFNFEKNSDLVKTILRINPALERRHCKESDLTSKIYSKNLSFHEKRQKTFLVSFNNKRLKRSNLYERLRKACSEQKIDWLNVLKNFK